MHRKWGILVKVNWSQSSSVQIPMYLLKDGRVLITGLGRSVTSKSRINQLGFQKWLN